MIKLNFKKILPLFLIFLPFVLFLEPLGTYFSQDDFFHLRVVMDKEVTDIPSFFMSLQKEYAFYRPLSRETFNLLMYRTFNLNPLPFHLVNLLLIILNGALVFAVSKKITKNITASLLAVLLYLFNSIHSIELYYLASVQTLLATIFMLLSLLFYPSSNRHLKSYFFSLLFFIMGLFSHEIAIVVIGIIFFLEIIISKKRIWDKSLVLLLSPFAIVGVFYLLNTSLFNRLPDQQVYQPVLSVKSIINTLGWYSLWVAGLPEMLVDFIGPKFAVNPNLLKWYGSFLKIVIPTFIFLGLSLGYILIIFRKNFLNRILLFFVISYIISLSPFLIFPQHKSSYYLTFASCWFSLILAQILFLAWGKHKNMKFLVILMVAAFMIISYQTIRLNKITYWAAKRAVAAESLLLTVKQQYPQIGKGSIFYIKNDPDYPFIAKEWGSSSKQAFYILSGSDAFKLLFKDPTIQVYFENIYPLPPTVNPSQVLSVIAKFPY